MSAALAGALVITMMVPPHLAFAATEPGANGNGQPTKWATKTSAEWHCVTITGDKDNVKVYVDGEKTAENKTSAPLTGSKLR